MAVSDLDAQFKATETEVAQGAKAVSERIERQQADDRSIIAKAIVIAFIAYIGLVIAATIIGVGFFQWERLLEPGKFLMGILSSVMLPVVTLVIGYYFGSK